MVTIKKCEEIKSHYIAGLLLGNSMRVAVSNKYNYNSLYERAAKVNAIYPEERRAIRICNIF